MNNETINGVAQKGSYKNFFLLPDSITAMASKASFGTEYDAFLADSIIFDGYVTTAAVNVNGIAADKETAKLKMAEEWGIINGDARAFARGNNETLYNQIKFTDSQINKMPDAESYGVCENEFLVLPPLVGTLGFPVIITDSLLDAANAKTLTFKGMVGAPEQAHHAQNLAKKALTDTWIPKMKTHYLNFEDLAMSMASSFPDFAGELSTLHKEGHSGIQHRGFTINAKSAVDGSAIHNVEITFPDYSTLKAPEFTDSMGNSPLITMLIGQWTIKCTVANFILQSFKPIFKENDVTHFDLIFAPTI